MNVCTRPGCQSSAGCQCVVGWSIPIVDRNIATMAVQLPVSRFGVTIAILDGDGNLTALVEQSTELGDALKRRDERLLSALAQGASE